MEKQLTFLKSIGLAESSELNILANALTELESEDNFLSETSQIGYYWVATALATGALQWIGGQVMQNLFGSGTQENNIGEILKNLVEQFKNIVHQEIEQEAVRQCISKISATQTNFLEYLNAPTDFKLELADNDSSHGVAGLKSLELAGYTAFISAVSLRITILQERAKHFSNNRSGELINIARLIRQSIEYHDAMMISWKKWNLSLYLRHTECRGNFCGLWVIKNGEVIFKVGNRAPERREEFIKTHSESSFNNEVYPKYIQPAVEIVRQWSCIENAIYWCKERGKEDIDSIAEITKKLASGIHIQDLE